jgi:hypothetical protein
MPTASSTDDTAPAPQALATLLAEAANLRASGALGRSAQVLRLFDYLVDCARRDHAPKELEIAVEALGRDAGFDPSQDTLVRVCAHKLRQRLEQHAARQDPAAPRLVLPRGEYRLQLELPVCVPAPTSPVDAPEAAPAQRRHSALQWLVLVLALVVVVLVVDRWRRPAFPAELREAAALAPWQPLFADGAPIEVLLGDYFIFGEHDPADPFHVPSRLVREFDINSRRELQQRQQADPAFAARSLDLDLGYLPTASAAALRATLPVLVTGGGELHTGLASQLVTDQFKRGHVVYIGYLSGLGLLEMPLFSASRFSIDASYDTLLDTRTGRAYVSEAGSPRDDASPFRDYGYVAAFRGPAGHAHLVIAGTRDAGLEEVAQLLARPERLRALRAAVGDTGSFEALYEVVGVRGRPVEARLLLASPLDSNALWALPAAAGAGG